MPCYDPLAAADTHAETVQKVNELTDMLCEALGMLETIGGKTKLEKLVSSRTQLWWAKHQEDDAVRKEAEEKEEKKERKRRAALKKLTPSERRLLGLRD